MKISSKENKREMKMKKKKKKKMTLYIYYILWFPATMGDRQQWYTLLISQVRDLSHRTVNIFLNVYTLYVMWLKLNPNFSFSKSNMFYICKKHKMGRKKIRFFWAKEMWRKKSGKTDVIHYQKKPNSVILMPYKTNDLGPVNV